MKLKSTLVLTALLMLSVFQLSAQSRANEMPDVISEYMIEKNDAAHPCITPGEYQQVEQRCAENARLYIHDQASRRTASGVPLNWPLQAASGLTDCSYYVIFAHVDQDVAATTFKDYNCGSIAYDGHHGTDIGVEPFPFYKMDNNQVTVIAAAAGTILDKHDGEFDRQCLGAGSNVTANYVIIQHSDGSRALYWHMKSGSIIAKAIGQPVVAGEQLGVVGSSGSSSGPHLHFEVWAGSTAGTYNDPFSGTCNYLNANSWWAAQKPYTEPAPMKASVHTTDIVFPACGTTETPNESTSYSIPFQGAGLSPGYAKFYVFLRNQMSGTTVSMSILNPNATTFASWTYNSSNNFNFSYLGYSKLLPTIAGTYTFNATYNGVTCTQSFNILNPAGLTEGALEGLSVYPNPLTNTMTIKTNTNEPCEIILYDIASKKLLQQKFTAITSINTEPFSKGVYLYEVKSQAGSVQRGKLVKE